MHKIVRVQQDRHYTVLWTIIRKARTHCQDVDNCGDEDHCRLPPWDRPLSDWKPLRIESTVRMEMSMQIDDQDWQWSALKLTIGNVIKV